MAQQKKPKKTAAKPAKRKTPQLAWHQRFRRWLLRWTLRVTLVVVIGPLLLIALFAVVNPPMGFYMRAEAARLGSVDREWVPIEEVADVMARSAVAAEDANFCLHWGIDMDAVRAAIESGGARGGSTISQQVAKNVFLWHGRSYVRKALEGLVTPAMELVWSKQRILEVYLNVAEFDEGIFGVEAAARHYFGVGPDQLSATQAARLAAILPSPKKRSASRPSSYVIKRGRQIASGAATIKEDGRAACFQ